MPFTDPNMDLFLARAPDAATQKEWFLKMGLFGRADIMEKAAVTGHQGPGFGADWSASIQEAVQPSAEKLIWGSTSYQIMRRLRTVRSWSDRPELVQVTSYGGGAGVGGFMTPGQLGGEYDITTRRVVDIIRAIGTVATTDGIAQLVKIVSIDGTTNLMDANEMLALERAMDILEKDIVWSRRRDDNGRELAFSINFRGIRDHIRDDGRLDAAGNPIQIINYNGLPFTQARIEDVLLGIADGWGDNAFIFCDNQAFTHWARTAPGADRYIIDRLTEGSNLDYIQSSVGRRIDEVLGHAGVAKLVPCTRLGLPWRSGAPGHGHPPTVAAAGAPAVGAPIATLLNLGATAGSNFLADNGVGTMFYVVTVSNHHRPPGQGGGETLPVQAGPLGVPGGVAVAAGEAVSVTIPTAGMPANSVFRIYKGNINAQQGNVQFCGEVFCDPTLANVVYTDLNQSVSQTIDTAGNRVFAGKAFSVGVAETSAQRRFRTVKGENLQKEGLVLAELLGWTKMRLAVTRDAISTLIKNYCCIVSPQPYVLWEIQNIGNRGL